MVPLVYKGTNGLDEVSRARKQIATAEIDIDAGEVENSTALAATLIASNGDATAASPAGATWSAEAIASPEAEIARTNLLNAARDAQDVGACSASVLSPSCTGLSNDLEAASGWYGTADLQFTSVSP